MNLLIIFAASLCLALPALAELNSPAKNETPKETIQRLRKKFRLDDPIEEEYLKNCEATAKLFFRSFPKEKSDFIDVTSSLACYKVYALDKDSLKKSKHPQKMACNGILTYLSDEYRVSTNDPKFEDLKRRCLTQKETSEEK